MNQLSLFDEDENKELEIGAIIISKEILSPLESKKNIKSKEFRKEQIIFSKYVRAIQSFHKCSFFKAKEMFFEARDSQKKIMVNFDIIF